MLFKTLGPVPTFRHIRFCGSNGWGLQGSPIETLKGAIFDPLLLLITSKDNPRQLTRKRKKMSSTNTMNNIKITDVFRRQPKSEQKTTPDKKISGEVNSELETGTDLHITSDVMHQGSKQMDSTKSLSISNQVLHNEMPDLAQNSNQFNPNNLMLSPGDQMNQMSGDQLNANHTQLQSA